MKKTALIIALGLVGSVLQAVPINVTLRTLGSAPALYLDAAKTVAVPSGYYAEVIISSSSIYDSENAYTILGNLSQDNGTTFLLSDVNVGTSVSGGSMGDGKISLMWANTSYAAGNYVAIRFYNSTDKSSATAYGVTSFLALTKSGTPTGVAEGETLSWQTSTTITTQNRYYTQYAIPEPTTMALFGLGGLALVLRRKMRKDA